MSRKDLQLSVVVIIMAVLVAGGILYYLTARNLSTSNQPAILNPVVHTGDYCSMANGCPTDKCRLVTQCAGGGSGEGCAQGETACEYKDLILKDNYTEVSANQARQCAQNFIDQNISIYPTLKYFKVDVISSGKESSDCDDKTFDKKDKFCWFMAMQPTDKNLPFAPQFYVGAQTCTVYWNLPSVFKTDLLSLVGVNYSPDQAVACAEKYIGANKTKYLEYENFVTESLSIPNKTPGPHAKVTDSTKDVSFYTVIGNSSPQGIYLVVGAHSCAVYGVNEQYYTKL